MKKARENYLSDSGAQNEKSVIASRIRREDCDVSRKTIEIDAAHRKPAEEGGRRGGQSAGDERYAEGYESVLYIKIRCVFSLAVRFFSLPPFRVDSFEVPPGKPLRNATCTKVLY